MFKSETMQFRVGLDMNHFQSLHLKITPVPETQWQWNAEEIQLLELFFSTKVVRPPFRPNGLVAFARMVSLPPKIIRDCIKIIRVQLIPSIVEQQGWLWKVQFCLTVPPAAIPIIPQGMPAVVISQSKFLIFLLLTRVQPPAPTPMETDGNEGQEPPKPPRESQFIVAPLIHETIMNVTSLAEKRASPGYVVPPECSALSQHLKRFADFTQPTLGMECSLFPAVQDILASFSFGQDGHGHGMHMPPMDMPPQMGMGRLPPQMGQQFMH
jgi:mediator of RNA polymerase II transcription subunit 14